MKLFWRPDCDFSNKYNVNKNGTKAVNGNETQRVELSKTLFEIKIFFFWMKYDLSFIEDKVDKIT